MHPSSAPFQAMSYLALTVSSGNCKNKIILKILLILPAPLCPVKFTIVRSVAYFTGVAPVDGTGVKEEEEGAKSGEGGVVLFGCRRVEF